MHRAMRLLAATVPALSSLVGCATEATPPGYNDALRELRRNAKSPGGVHYLRAFERTIRESLVFAERKCRSVRFADKRGSVLLYRIDSSGEPASSIVHPSTEYAMCMHEEIREFVLEPPPRPDYWIGVSLPAVEPG